MRVQVITLFLAALVFNVSTAFAAPLLTYGTVFQANGYPNDQTLQGWQFSANQSIAITHLGLFDDDSDGFDVAHLVGLFRVADGALLTSAVVNAGASDPLLINGFRYVDVFDVPLVVGEEYVLAYYTNDPLHINRDHMIATWDVRTVDSAITLGYGRWQQNASSFGMPQNTDLRGVFYVGPNALFATVPVPPAVWLFGSALGLMGWMRRKAAA